MPLFLIAYDLDTELDPDYDALIDVLEPLGAKRIQKSLWAIEGNEELLRGLFTSLRAVHIADNDRLVIAEVSRSVEWNSINALGAEETKPR
jgi:CRISPR/Cas system-associated endoribonuclease Cas2